MAIAFFLLVSAGVFQFFTVSGTTPKGSLAEPVDLISLSTALITKWVLPFVLTSVILLVAVIGAVVMARKQDEDGNEIMVEVD
jgi:NADH-quinone oxidoreductase subunit J